jgi:hypothetical protein
MTRTLAAMLRAIAMLVAGTAATLASAAAPAPIVRTQLTPAAATVGQSVKLGIEVLVPTWFTAPIEYPASVVVDGLTVRLAERAEGNRSEKIDGETWAGIARSYEIVAQRAGRYTLPPLELQVTYSVDGASRSVKVRTTASAFEARLPAGAEGLGYFVATPRYTLTQEIDRPLKDLKAGDAFTRRIVQRAEGIPAMQLPALDFAPIAGLATYPGEPRLDTRGGERGAPVVAERTQQVTYVLRDAGRYDLPALTISWFDSTAARMRDARLPALRFDVAPGPAAKSEAPPAAAPPPAFAAPRVSVRTAVAVAALTALELYVVLQLRRRGPRWWRAWSAWLRRRAAGEGAAFRRCRRALATATPGEALAAAQRWLDCLPQRRGMPPLAAFAAVHGDAALHAAIATLQRAAYGPAPDAVAARPAVAAFARALAQARGRRRAASRLNRAHGGLAATLNPDPADAARIAYQRGGS